MSCTTVQKLSLEGLKAMECLTITRADVAAVLGVDPRTVTTGINEGTIPAIKLGRRVLIPRDKFIKLFEAVDD